MKFFSAALMFLGLFWATCVFADPCEFKGIHVGAKMAPSEVMNALGVPKFKTNPKRLEFNARLANMKKFGLTPAVEMEEQDIGPFCEGEGDEVYCRNPAGTWGVDKQWMKVFVRITKGMVETIDVSFDASAAEGFVQLARRRYGLAGWHTERQQLSIVNMEDKSSILVDRVTETKVTKVCRTMITNYDVIEVHHAGPPYQGIMEIKRLDLDF